MRFSKIIIMLVSLGITTSTHAQNITATPIDKLPLNIIAATNDTSKAMILYITGDGGWNKFSKNLAVAFAGKGYPVVALNANDYFWKKKTPEQAAADISFLIKTYQKIWNRKEVALIGYSFGADVMPFIFNLLPADVSAQVTNVSLLSASAYTDFEIHISVMFGAGFNRGESVVKEINKIKNKPVLLIFGEEENSFPFNQLTLKNYTHLTLQGGHHYDGDEAGLCNTIAQYIHKK